MHLSWWENHFSMQEFFLCVNTSSVGTLCPLVETHLFFVRECILMWEKFTSLGELYFPVGSPDHPVRKKHLCVEEPNLPVEKHTFLLGNTPFCCCCSFVEHISLWGNCVSMREHMFLWQKCTFLWGKHTFLWGNPSLFGGISSSYGESATSYWGTLLPVEEIHFFVGEHIFLWGEFTCLCRNPSFCGERISPEQETHLPVQEHTFLWENPSCVGKAPSCGGNPSSYME